MRRTILVALLVAGLASPTNSAVFGAAAPLDRVGIARLGLAEGDGFVQFEKNLSHWLENDRAIGVKTEQIGSVEQALKTVQEHIRGLEAHITQLRASQPSPEGDRINTSVETDISFLEPFAELSPLFQRARFAQAVYAKRSGRESLVLQFLTIALSYHPEGLLQETAELVGMDASSKARWKETIHSVSESLTRGCYFDLQVSPPETQIVVNGFAMGGRRAFHLLRGKSYEAILKADKYGARELLMDCRRSGQWLETVKLEPGVPGDEQTLTRLRRLSRIHPFSNLLVSMPTQGDQFGLFLYTPGVGLDPVPTSAPLASNRLGEGTVQEGRPPFAADAMLALFEKHRSLPLRAAFAQSGESGYASAGKVSTLEPVAWYERREFWILTGVVAAGVAATLLLTGKHPQVQTNPALSAHLH